MKHQPDKKRGRLFVFEGPDDVGKSSLAKMLHQHLLTSGRQCELLSFPGSEPRTLGELVYRFYHNPGDFGVANVCGFSMQVLVTAAHIEVIESRVKPLIRHGVDVVLDRFWWSTWVYATIDGLSQSSRDKILNVEMESWDGITPAVIYFVLRQKPLLEQPKNYPWSEIRSLYLQLFETQKERANVHVVINETTLNKALEIVLSNLG